MKYLILILLTLFSLTLHATTKLKTNYIIEHNYILLSDIINTPKIDKKLFNITKGKHSKRIKSVTLIKTLKELGYTDYSSKHSYIQFSKKSPINTSKIAFFIQSNYQQFYKDIEILAIEVNPRSYIDEMPREYIVELQKRAVLSKKGIVSIKTPSNKKIFFNYYIKAKIPVLVTKSLLNKGDELSNLNVKKSSIMLDKFRAKPLQKLKSATYEAKHRLKKDVTLTTRDVLGLYLVKRGSNVNVVIKDSSMAISYNAKAHTSARYGETVVLIGAHGKKIKAIVIGRNRAEIR